MEGIGMHAASRPTDSLDIHRGEAARRPFGPRHALALLAVVGAAISALLLLPLSGSANTLEVGPGGYATISAAVQAAGPGDTILIHAGTYREQANLDKQLTVRPYGDGPVTVDGECQREHGVYIGSGSGMVIQGFTIKRTIAASIFIEHASNVTIDGMTLQDFDCQDLGDVWRAGVASWYGGSNITITGNLIQRRASGEPRGWADGIWFKSNDSNPSGGGHYIAGNTIVGGWDGIGGEEEGSAHGTFDKNTVIENNTIRDCADDGIQVEGGDQNVRVRNNDIAGCGTGIAFAAPITGPLYIENNHIHDLAVGWYDNLFCFKVGNDGGGTTYLTGNTCDVGEDADGIHQTNEGLSPIVSRRNVFHVSRYVFTLGYPSVPAGMDFDEDCIWSTNENIIKWANTYYTSLASFQAATGQEQNGRQGQDCSSPGTPSPTPTRTPTSTPTRTPSPTPTLTPAHTPGPLPTTTTGTSTPDESPLISAAMAPGWNYQCYVGSSRPTEEALAAAAGRVSAVYRLGDSGVFDRWFPNLPEVSTLTTVDPGDALFLLTSDPFLWAQSISDADSAVDLAPGWNSVCYSGGSGPVEAVTRGIDLLYTVIYTLAPDHTWQRFVPGKPEVCSLSELARFTPVLILVTGGNGRWAFSP